MIAKLILAAAAATMTLAPAAAADYPWKPERTINVIVPWGAGGSTDQVVRLLAAEIGDELGQTIVVVNQPGAGGSIGTKAVLDAPHDGYTWASGAAKDLGVYPVSGLLDTRLDQWELFLGVINSAMISVGADSPHKTLDDLVKAMKDKPGSVTFATAGINSSGGAALGAFSTGAGVEARQVTYDGGNPAVIATASGEAMATSQLASEQAEMVRAGRLRPLAVIGSRPLVLEGFGEIPAITTFLPDFPVSDNHFGIFVPSDAPAEVIQTLEQVWDNRIAKSEALASYAGRAGAIKAVSRGQDAVDAVMPAVKDFAWGMWDRKEAKVDPATVGIPPR